MWHSRFAMSIFNSTKKTLLKLLWAGLLWFWGSFKWHYVCSSERHFVAMCVTHKSDTVSKQTLCRHLSVTNDPNCKLVKLSADLPVPKLKTTNKRLNFRIRMDLEHFFFPNLCRISWHQLFCAVTPRMLSFLKCPILHLVTIRVTHDHWTNK